MKNIEKNVSIAPLIFGKAVSKVAFESKPINESVQSYQALGLKSQTHGLRVARNSFEKRKIHIVHNFHVQSSLTMFVV